ncbi:putative RNA polymerase ECF-subfamily sigma factor [Alloactinosynnema sp. L-07]|uniref:sigma-70 family RNA polymerase sigma factor n=1 Tax=Alloactinosynnema sp. L-07 TaxID=1653480 RepID=UPI00065F010B|nr:sigma-70 family RNA polymerase sigma factor [Alloactinosynnema sp. L-07]CRK60095.1 putative RNA polymerase ECF-subfamily sigma factor [Alloactinosynnema sp. L-07]
MQDELDFDGFVRERYDQLLRYAVMLTGRRWDAEEILQEALVRCLRRWRKVPADNAVAYARKAIYNEFLRSAKRKTVVTLDEIAEQLDLEDFSGAVVAREHVLAVLQTLPPRQRAAVVARFVLDLTEAQAAVELGCSVGTIKSLTSRGLAKVRQTWKAGELAADAVASPGRRGA